MLALTVGTALLVPAAALIAFCLRVRGWLPLLVAATTVGAAIVVALTLALSALEAYEREAMLLGHVLVLAGAVVWWMRAGRPSGGVPPLPDRAAIVAAARGNGTVAVLLTAVLVAALTELVLGLTVAPNSFDSLMYHLSRAALWIQDGTVFGTEGTVYQTQYAPNGEYLLGWTMLLSDGDRFAALVAWVAALGCGALVAIGARMLGFTGAAAAFAAALFLLMPQIVVQASSTLVDLPAAFFAGAFAIFALRWIDSESMGDLVVAALALGLATGTKGTAFLALPGLLLILIVTFVRRRPGGRGLAWAAAVLAAGALVLGGQQYARNLAETGDPAGEAGRSQTRSSSIVTTAKRTVWSFVDMPGLEGTLPSRLLRPVHDRIWPSGEDPFNDTYVSEDGIGFGPLAPLLLLPLLVGYAVSPRAAPCRRLVAVAAGSSIVLYAVVLEVGFNASHTLVTSVLIGAPLLAWAYRPTWIRHVTAFVALAFLIPVLLQNAKKPLYPDPAIDLDRITQQSMQHGFEPALRRADELLAPDTRLAYVGPRDATWDYPFFGPGLDRFVRRVEADSHDPPTAEEIDSLIAEEDLDAVVWAGVRAPVGRPTTELGEIAFTDHRIWVEGSVRSPAR